MLINDMDISMLMVYVQQIVDEKLRDREEIKNNRAKIGNQFMQRRVMATSNLSKKKQSGLAPSFDSEPAPRNKGEYSALNSQILRAISSQSHDSLEQGGNWAFICDRCCKTHP